MTKELLADVIKAHDHLNEIKFKVSGTQYIFYYRYMTILEHTRINLACTKETTYIAENGKKEVRKEKQEHLFPIYTILEKALDKDGKKLFSLTDKEAFEIFSKMDLKLLSLIAAEMSLDITGNLERFTDGWENWIRHCRKW